MRNEDCAAFFTVLQSEYPLPKRILVGECTYGTCPYDYAIESFSPAKLLEVLRGAFPEESTMIETREEELEADLQ